MRANWFQYQVKAEPVWEAVAPPPVPFDPSENISFYQEHFRQEPAKAIHPATTGWITESWFRESNEETVGSQMAWYRPLSLPQRLSPLPRAANRVQGIVQPVSFTDPSYSVAQLMAWHEPIQQPRIIRQLRVSSLVQSLLPIQPHYGGAFVGVLYTEPTYKVAGRIGAEPTYIATQVRSQP